MLDVQCSMFDVHSFLFRLNWPLFRPAAGLKSDTWHLKPKSYALYLLPYTQSLRREPNAVRRFFEPLNL